MTSLFQKNLDIIKARASEHTVQSILDAAHDEQVISIEEDAQGRRRFVAGTPDGKRLTLHSPRDPNGQAERQVVAWEDENDRSGPNRVLFVLGFGGGYHLPPLLERLHKRAVLVVIEPSPRALYDVLSYIDLGFLEDVAVEVKFIVRPKREKIYWEVNNIVGGKTRREPACFVHPSLLRVESDTYRDIAYHLAETIRAADVNRNTLVGFSRKWLRNALSNIPRLASSTSVQRLEYIFEGFPAAVVAAGPSLDETMTLLSSIRDQVVIIAVGTAYKPLRKAGIIPDFVTVIDGKDVIAKQFQGVDTSGTILLTPPQVVPGVYEQFDSDHTVTFATNGLPSFEATLQEWQMGAQHLRIGGTVTHSALSAAVFFGCRDIYTFGLDLACREDLVKHASEAVNTENKKDVVPQRELEWIPGNKVDVVPTSQDMRIYAQALSQYAEELVETMNVTITNVNPGGAKIKNTTYCPPEDFVLDTPNIRSTVKYRLDNAFQRDPRGLPEKLRPLLQDARQELMQLKCDAEQAEKLCKYLSENKKLGDKKKNSKLDQLKKVEKRISKKGIAKRLVDGAVQGSSIQTLNAFMLLDTDAQEEKEEQEFQRLHHQSARFYKLVAKAAEWCRDHLADVYKQLEEDGHPSPSRQASKNFEQR